MDTLKFLTVIGSNASGKSSIGGDITSLLGSENIASVGKYKKREGRNFFTGGADGFRGGTLERKAALKEIWMSDTPVVLCEGIMVSSMTFMNYYQLLQKLKYREIHVIYLHQPLELLLERITLRSGREITLKRIRLARCRTRVIDNLYHKIIDNLNIITKKFSMALLLNSTYEVRKYILEKIGFGDKISGIIAIPQVHTVGLA